MKKIFIFLLIFYLTIAHAKSNLSILENENFLFPLLTPIDTNRYHSILSSKDLDPLHIGTLAVTYFLYGKKENNKQYIKNAKNLLKILDNFPYKKENNSSCIYLYNFNDKSFKAKKWWSGMANSSVALAYLYGYTITGNKNYKISAVKALNGTINPIQENGSALTLNKNSSWYLEFADINSTTENSQFVLNGFQFSLLVIKIFEQVLDNDKMRHAYFKGINGFKLMSKKYYLDEEWIFYMLNPATPTPPHYAIYDSLLISSLMMYDKKNHEFLFKEFEKRKKIFIKNYNLEKDENGNILFSAIGAPNPFWIDLYTTILRTHYKDSNTKDLVLNTSDFQNGLYKRSFKFINDSKNINSIEVLQNKYGHLISLYKVNVADIKNIDHNQSLPHFIDANKTVMYDLTKENNETFIIHYQEKDSKAVMRYIFNKPIDLMKKKYFAIFLKNEADLKYLQVTIIDINDNAISRYYPAQKKGKNLILVSPLGFNGYSNINSNIKEVRFYLGFNSSDLKRSKVDFSNLFYMNSNIPLYKLFSTNYMFNNECFNFLTTHTGKH